MGSSREALNREETVSEPEFPGPDLSRRRALTQLSVIFAGTWTLPWLEQLSPETLLANGTELHRHVAARSTVGREVSAKKLLFFNPHQFKTVDIVCEIVIPQTRTPGARAANVPQFIDLLLAERETQMQSGIAAGLRWLDQRTRELFGKDFVDASPEQQIDLLTRISSPDSSEATLGRVFFNQIKNLTAFGYYTSKEGLEQELGYAGPQGIGTYEGSVAVEPR
jgi:Gluconate 2-dehydrogenase subunit 3